MLDLFIILSYFVITLIVGIRAGENTYARRSFVLISPNYHSSSRVHTIWTICVAAANGMYASDLISMRRSITKMSLLFCEFWIAALLLGLGTAIEWRISDSGFGLDFLVSGMLVNALVFRTVSKLRRSQSSPPFILHMDTQANYNYAVKS